MVLGIYASGTPVGRFDRDVTMHDDSAAQSIVPPSPPNGQTLGDASVRSSAIRTLIDGNGVSVVVCTLT